MVYWCVLPSDLLMALTDRTTIYLCRKVELVDARVVDIGVREAEIR